MTIDSPALLDTNILVYAYDSDEGEKHAIAKSLIQSCFDGKMNLCVSNQVLAEFIHVTRFRMPKPISRAEAEDIVKRISVIPSWIKVNYSTETLVRAFALSDEKTYFWDFIIAQTMLENGISIIYTENTKDFEHVRGIKVINPFKE